MKISADRVLAAAIGLLWTAQLAYGHPGHDGHDLTWEFRHLAQHPLATVGCAAVIGGAVAALVQVVRYRAPRRLQSLRGSHFSRGK